MTSELRLKFVTSNSWQNAARVFLLVYFVCSRYDFFYKVPTQTEALLKRCFFVHHVFGAIEALLANLVEGAVEWQGGFLAKFSKYLESSSLVKNYGL